MIKYVDYDIVFQEVPGEVSLALNISNCPFRCEGCHSPHLRQDIGRDLAEDLPILLKKYSGMITCVLFLGEGQDKRALFDLITDIHERDLKSAVYSGSEIPEKGEDLFELFFELGFPTYVKIGPYKKEFGGLNSPETNQRMYRWNQDIFNYEDITHLFWKKHE